MNEASEYRFNLHVLALATIVSVLSVFSSVIEKPVLKWLNKHTERERTLLQQRNSLKDQQLSINIVDEFAKYSKIQRRINGINEELEHIKGSKPTNSFVVQLGFTYAIKMCLVAVLIGLSLYYRYTPVLYLGDRVDLTPFTNFICYPNGVNHVSFYFWVMCCASVARLLKSCMNNSNKANCY